MTLSAQGAAAAAGDNPVIETGARVGYAANGVLHLIIAWLALQVAWGLAGADADQTGALGWLAGTALGAALLWVVAVGFGLLGLWQVTEVVARQDGRIRARAAAKAAVYLALAWTAVAVVRGTSTSGPEQTTAFTARLLGHPMGQALVVLVGLAILGVAAHHVTKGWRRTFLQDLQEQPGDTAVRIGQVGYLAKAAALTVVGGLFVAAALTRDPSRAQGLDGALRALLEVPLGRVLLTLVALGLAAYGLYSFVRARYARV
jgi:hypothetical protein